MADTGTNSCRDEMPPTLDTATLEDILQELKRRYDCYLLALSGKTNNAKENKDEVQVWYFGGFIAGMGLATAANAYLTNDFLSKG